MNFGKITPLTKCSGRTVLYLKIHNDFAKITAHKISSNTFFYVTEKIKMKLYRRHLRQKHL